MKLCLLTGGLDDMNIDIESRRIWISMSEKYGVTADVVHFTTQTDLCLHNDSVRALGGPSVSTYPLPTFSTPYAPT